MKLKTKSFTMVELIITIVVLLILSSFVVSSVVGAQEKAEDDKMISNANIFASAMNQYAIDHGRKFLGFSGLGVMDPETYYGIRASWLIGNTFADNYLSDANKVLSGDMQYIVKGDLTRAAVITPPKNVKGVSKSCNFSIDAAAKVPTIIQQYRLRNIVVNSGGPSQFKFFISEPDPGIACYYVAL